MAFLKRVLIGLVACGALACSEDGAPADGGESGSGGSSGASGSSGAGGSSGSSTGGSSGASGSSGSSGSNTGGSSGSSSGNGGSAGTAGTDSGGAPPGVASPMPLISRNVPAFASTSVNDANGPSKSNDALSNTAWFSGGVPAWIAYDLSGVPAAQRDDILVAFYAFKTPEYINAMPQAYMELPIDYTVEINTGDGGGAPPTSGWTEVANVANNNRESREHLIEFGANWVRVNVTESSDPAAVSFDLDVYSAPNGASDAWLFMGDSITFISMNRAFSDLPQLVNNADPSRWPAIVPAGIGGTSTATAISVIEETLRDYPGRFVCLNYGTNDHANEYHMEELIQTVLAANKIPVIPHIPWSDTPQIQTDGPIINGIIDQLLTQYPDALAGPDLWAAFEGRLDLIPSGDVHPNEPGQEFLRQQWASWLVAAGE